MRADANEAEKIKTDLSRLRNEIEQADLEDEEVNRSQRIQINSQETQRIVPYNRYTDGF